MGWNTTVVIYNDHLSWIEEDPDFGRKLSEAIRQLNNPYSIKPISFGSGIVIETHHADHTVTVKVGQNTGEVVEE